MTLKLFNPNGRTCLALVSLSFGYTFSPEHWLCFPRLSSLLLLTGPEIFTGFFPFGVSAPPQFILLLVILFVFIANSLFFYPSAGYVIF